MVLRAYILIAILVIMLILLVGQYDIVWACLSLARLLELPKWRGLQHWFIKDERGTVSPRGGAGGRRGMG